MAKRNTRMLLAIMAGMANEVETHVFKRPDFLEPLMPCAACDGSGDRADMPGHAGEPGRCYRCDGSGNDRTKETA